MHIRIHPAKGTIIESVPVPLSLFFGLRRLSVVSNLVEKVRTYIKKVRT
jgi:hypothetical protein